MILTITGPVLAILALIITYRLTDRSFWRIVVLSVGIIGAVLSFVQSYRNGERAANLQDALGALWLQQDYSSVSRYNAFGLLGLARPPLTEHSSLNNIIGNYLHEVPNNIVWDCTPEAVKAYTQAIKFEPKFPFTYYYKAGCEKEGSAADWQHDLDTARTILKITTQIPGHHPHHDTVLQWIRAGNLGER